MDPRAKNCLQALAMLCSTAGLVKRDLLQRYPRHFASGMIWTVEFKRLIAKALCEGFLENRTTSVLGSLRERPLLVAKSAIILL